MRARSLFCFGSSIDFDGLFNPFCRQSLALCLILWQLKQQVSFMCLFLSSMVILSMSIVFGSLVNLGVVKVLFVCVVVETPRRQLRISLTCLYCASYRDACSYHSPIVFGMVGCANIFWRIPTLSPSMKYSMSAVSSVILALPAKIRNCATYSLTVPFPWRS